MNIAVGFIHGIGKQKEGFHENMANLLRERIAKECPEINLVTEGIYWADITDRLENKLFETLRPYHLRWDNWFNIRGFAISYLGDAIAYQAVPQEDGREESTFIYADIHERVFEKLEILARKAGPNAPLCLIAHSLGTIIASNYLYDLQNGKLPERIREKIIVSDAPLVHGDTLTHLYTMGSPIAIWTMRYDDFGKPIAFPVPALAAQGKTVGEWVNFYDKDDPIAYPIQQLSDRYRQTVTADVDVNNPGVLANTPLGSHGGYYHSDKVINRIAESLISFYNKTTTNIDIA